MTWWQDNCACLECECDCLMDTDQRQCEACRSGDHATQTEWEDGSNRDDFHPVRDAEPVLA